ncbi:MAG: hypothetical protein ABEH90_00560 [Halolamina sp.]
MANGFGAAFGGLLLLAVVAGLAGLLALFLAGAVAFRKRGERVPSGLRYLPVAVVTGVVLVAGFAVAALVDEAAAVAAVFVATVFVPFGAVGGFLLWMSELSRLDAVATTGLAWGVPYLLGLGVTFGVPILITRTFGLAPAKSRHLGLYWLGTVLGGIVVVLGTLRLAEHVADSVLGE